MGWDMTIEKLARVGTMAVAPGPPPAPTVRPGKPRCSSIHIKWTAPAYLGGSPIKSYLVEVTSGSLLAPHWVEAYQGPDLEVAITGCPPGTEYFARVFARNAAGESPASQVEQCRTEAAAPLPPTGVHITTCGASRAAVQWTAADGQGETVTQYRLELCLAPLTPVTPASHFETVWSGDKLAAEIKNLLPNTKYLLRLQVASVQDADGCRNLTGMAPQQALNRMGVSGYSDELAFTTTASCPGALPAAPELVMAGQSQLTIKWNAPPNNGEPITSFKFERPLWGVEFGCV
jgi:hypothetical protein